VTDFTGQGLTLALGWLCADVAAVHWSLRRLQAGGNNQAQNLTAGKIIVHVKMLFIDAF